MSKKSLLLVGCAGFVLVAGGCLVLALVLGVVATDDAPEIASVSQSPNQAVPQPAPPFDEIRTNHETMTEAQWKQYRGQVEGTRVQGWQGWVEEVEDNSGRYWVHVDMDSPDAILSVAEIRFLVPKDLALSLQMDQALTFSGRVETAQDFVGTLDIVLEDVELQ